MIKFKYKFIKEVLQINSRLLLKKYFGYDNFRPGQENIIDNILNNRDSLGIMPTGAGKSICYQIPAMMFLGVTVVISPLISLMKDQVDTLNEVGIPATYINSTLSSFEYEQSIQNIYQNVYKIIYIAPERLNSQTFINLLNSINVSMITVDEAHCISQWGHDFRPTYKEIANVILNLKTRPIVSAFTATATEIVKEDIINLLHLESPFVLTTGFDRKNLSFSVETPTNKKEYVLDFIEKNANDSGIIYCATRKTVDSLYDEISELGYNVSKYHGGMTEKARTRNQEDFVYDKTDIMIATNAFGMGIDKSNIRYVIHYNMPKDLESYYQEAGRAGRDGDDSKCILLFSRADIVTNKFLIEHTTSDSDDSENSFDEEGYFFDDTPNHRIEYAKLNDIVDYCNTDRCLRKYILEYFGELPLFENCDNCSNCLSETEVTDITIDAKKILSCIKRMRENFGSGLVADVLKGSKSARIKTLRFDSLSTYGIMAEYSKDTIKDLIYFLITEGYIDSVGDKYPVLRLNPRATNVLFNGETVSIKRKIEKIPEKHVDDSTGKYSANNMNYDASLFEILRGIRREIAEDNNVPPFVIFSDVSLKQMATFYPINKERMLKINGVGSVKLEKYGDVFIEAICDYVKENDISVDELAENFESDDIDNSNTAENNSSNKTSTKKASTHVVSYELFNEGHSIREIASIREVHVRTIEDHLLKCFELGMDIDLSGVVQGKFESLIYEAIASLGTEKLRPLKDALPDEVSYFDIHYFVIKYKKEHCEMFMD